MSPNGTVSSYLTLFTFALKNQGSFVSVALSLASLPVAVSDYSSLKVPGLSSPHLLALKDRFFFKVVAAHDHNS